MKRIPFLRSFLLSSIVLTLNTLILSQFPLYGQEKVRLTLEQVIAGNEYAPERFIRAVWLSDGSGFTTLEKNTTLGMGMDVVKYEALTGKRSVLVSASQLIPFGKDQAVVTQDYTFSADGSRVLIFTNSKRVWRQNTKGDYWVLDLTTNILKQLGTFAPPSSLMFAKFSPDGRKAAYVFRNNIYVEDLGSGELIQLTTDGSKHIINGTFDWVYEEEFDLRDGFRWSPDSRYIAYWQLNTEGVREFYMINNTDSLYPFVIPVKYPKVGETLSECRIGVVPAAGGATVWMKTDPDYRNNYIARMDWAFNSGEIIFQYLNRRQNTNRVMLGDIHTGETRNIYTETDDAWLDVVDDLVWTKKGEEFTWLSEKTGWRHFYLIGRDGKKIIPVTGGAFDVISVEHVDLNKGYLYYLASPDNPTQRYLYRVRLNGKKPPEKLSPVDQPGVHSYQISPNAKWAIHTFVSSKEPATVDLVSLPDHKRVRMLVENKKLKEKLAMLDVSPVEFFRVDIGDGVLLDGWMIKPPGFDSTMKYPVLFNVYGEPAGVTVLDRQPSLYHLFLSQQGYIIASIDSRGTPAPRGREWRKCVYMKVGTLNTADQAKAARIISEWDFVDKDRIGIWGWSGGGTSTLNAILQYPDIYHTGMAVAPVPDLSLYDAVYEERYMRTVKDNPDGYTNGSPVSHAANLKGNLLIVHGTGDDNVHYQGTERLINELIRYNKQFTMMAYPNRSHGIFEGQGTTMHLYTLLTEYLLRQMPPGPKK